MDKPPQSGRVIPKALWIAAAPIGLSMVAMLFAALSARGSNETTKYIRQTVPFVLRAPGDEGAGDITIDDSLEWASRRAGTSYRLPNDLRQEIQALRLAWCYNPPAWSLKHGANSYDLALGCEGKFGFTKHQFFIPPDRLPAPLARLVKLVK